MTIKLGDPRAWYLDQRFGLFIHWGLYAIDAWHEQIQWRQNIPRKNYQELITRFNPANFDPDAWLDAAQDAGMQYLCFTTKHHDGFCLWNTHQTDFNVTNSPYRRDVLQILADACHRRAFPLCLYYSVVDWHHPNYPNQNRNHELPAPEPSDQPDLEKYLDFLKAQVHELCTQYGAIHGFFWDMNSTGLTDPAINQAIRKLQPQAVINSRGFDPGDFLTTEREYDPFVDQVTDFDQLTEATTSIGQQSWGYRAEEDYHTYGYLIRDIDKIFAKGGRYLLNVGPTAQGAFPPQALSILRHIGAWHRAVAPAFNAACPASSLTHNRDVLLTRNGNNLYVHLHAQPKSSGVLLNPINTLPRRAVLLNTGAPVQTRVDLLPMLHETDRSKYLRLLNLPANEFANSVMVVELEFDDLPAALNQTEPINENSP